MFGEKRKVKGLLQKIIILIGRKICKEEGMEKTL